MEFRIYLRALEPEDYKVTHTWRNDDEITSMVGGGKFYVSLEKERKWVEKCINDDSRLVLGICLKENDKLIGTVNMQEIDYLNRSCHVPILIGDKTEWHKGYATEARMLMLDFVFNERGMERVWATIVDTNAASVKMHEKCGYVTEGVMRNSVFKGGRFHNQYLMSVLKDEFKVAYQKYIESHT